MHSTCPPWGRHKKKLHLLKQTENCGICHESCKTNLCRVIQNKTATSRVISVLLMNTHGLDLWRSLTRGGYFSILMFSVRMPYDLVHYVRLKSRDLLELWWREKSELVSRIQIRVIWIKPCGMQMFVIASDIIKGDACKKNTSWQNDRPWFCPPVT